MSVEFFLFFLELNAADIADGDCCAYNADYAERVGTSVSIGDCRNVAVGKYCVKCLVGSTKTWCVGNSSVHRTHHHREVDRVRCVEEDVIACKHHQYVETDG